MPLESHHSVAIEIYNANRACQTEKIRRPKFTTPDPDLRAAGSPQEYFRQSLTAPRKFLAFFNETHIFEETTTCPPIPPRQFNSLYSQSHLFSQLLHNGDWLYRVPSVRNPNNDVVDYDPAKRPGARAVVARGKMSET